MVSWEDVIKSKARASGNPSCVKNMRESKEVDAVMISEGHSEGLVSLNIIIRKWQQLCAGSSS